MELSGRLVVIWLIKRVDLGLGRNLLIIGEVISGSELSFLPLDKISSTSSSASPCPKRISLFSPLW